MTLAKQFESRAGEPIISAVASGRQPRQWAHDEDPRQILFLSLPHFVLAPSVVTTGVIPWDRMRTLLDYEYESGYGSEDCHAVTAWSENWTLFVACYDGSTWVERIPRNPTNHTPEYVGGG